jgi:hypothetical protein|tara:strand:+ start:2077 stop:2307 length:231 start_codon:yes stop_codon:yes gene_type:complete
MSTPLHLGELVYLTNRLARGYPDASFTQKNGPGMIVDIAAPQGFNARYMIRWLKSGAEMEFHADCLVRVIADETKL